MKDEICEATAQIYSLVVGIQHPLSETRFQAAKQADNNINLLLGERITSRLRQVVLLAGGARAAILREIGSRVTGVE